MAPAQSAVLLYYDHVEGRGVELFRRVCDRDLEGIFAKRKNGVHTPEETSWVNIKNASYSQVMGRDERFEKGPEQVGDPGMRQLFQELVAEVRRINPGAAGLLRPGLSPEVAKQKLAAVPFHVTSDAAALYTWADGADGRFEMLPGAYFMPLDEALLEFEEIHRIRDELEEIFPQRYRDSFRFLTDWSDGGYAFGRIGPPSQGQIVHLCIHAPWLLAFHDLADLLKTSIACYRQGVMRPGSDIPDFRAYYKLAARMNPGLENWR